MAKAFSSPVEYTFPTDFKQWQEHDAAYIEAVRDELHERGYNEEYTGSVIRFPIADGYAQYMVASMKPLRLVHLPIGDAWQIPVAHMRGLRADEVKARIGYEKNLDAIFGRK